MGRGFRRGGPPPEQQHRVNHRIRIPEVRVIGPEGEQLGVMSPDQGRRIAEEHGLDLVEVAPQSRPPVCKIMDYGKFKYEQSKKKVGKQSSGPEVKTVQMRPKTDDHDLQTKLKRCRSFLERGDKVRIVMRMRGREQAYPGRWISMMQEQFAEHLADVGKIASAPSRQGRTITLVVEPDRRAGGGGGASSSASSASSAGSSGSASGDIASGGGNS